MFTLITQIDVITGIVYALALGLFTGFVVSILLTWIRH